MLGVKLNHVTKRVYRSSNTCNTNALEHISSFSLVYEFQQMDLQHKLDHYD